MEKLLALKNSDTIKEALDGLKESFPDSIRDEEVKKTGFSPSALVWGDGKCARRWHLLFDGASWYSEDTAVSIDRMRAGTDGHERIQKRLEEGPLKVRIEENLRMKNPPLNSYCDAVIETEDKVIPLEIKTVGDMAFEARKTSQKPAHYHITQLLLYMHILDTDEGIILYENRDSFHKLAIPIYMTDEYRTYIAELIDWMTVVYGSHEDGMLAKVFKGRRKNSRMCASCPVRQACDDAREGEIQIPLLKGLDKQ